MRALRLFCLPYVLLALIADAGVGSCGEQSIPSVPQTPGIPQTATEVAASQNPVEESEITNSIGMKLRRIAPGQFLMGSSDEDISRRQNECPQHVVKISKEFHIGVTEVTQGQWYSLMETRPWDFKYYVKNGSTYPAMYISWNDAVRFCRRLSEREKVTYRLPTEGEWEYACRGGNDAKFCFGDDIRMLDEFAWIHENSGDHISTRCPHPVGQKKPNELGLFDMHGNMWEWCQDAYSETEYQDRSGTVVDPVRDPGGKQPNCDRVMRGGSWWYRGKDARSALRGRLPQNADYNSAGFRVVMVKLNPIESNPEPDGKPGGPENPVPTPSAPVPVPNSTSPFSAAIEQQWWGEMFQCIPYINTLPSPIPACGCFLMQYGN